MTASAERRPKHPVPMVDRHMVDRTPLSRELGAEGEAVATDAARRRMVHVVESRIGDRFNRPMTADQLVRSQIAVEKATGRKYNHDAVVAGMTLTLPVTEEASSPVTSPRRTGGFDPARIQLDSAPGEEHVSGGTVGAALIGNKRAAPRV